MPVEQARESSQRRKAKSMYGSSCGFRLRVILEFILLPLSVCCGFLANAQSAATTPQWPSRRLEAEANRQAEILWGRILTHCGESYYYAGSGLDDFTMNGQQRAYGNGLGGDITEYRDVRFIVLPPGAQSAAEQLNESDEGSQEGGTAVLLSKFYRSGDRETHRWSPWVDGPLSKAPAGSLSNPQALGALYAASFTSAAAASTGIAGSEGLIAVHMQQVHGQWQYKLVGHTGSTTRAEYALTSGIQRPFACENLQSPFPISQPTPQTPKSGVQALASAGPVSCDTGSHRTPAPARLMNISAGVASGMLIQRTMPVYPPEAKAAGLSGTVVLQALIAPDGLVRELRPISSPSPSLTAAATQSVCTWRYRPYLLNNAPVAVETTINVIFSPGR